MEPFGRTRTFSADKQLPEEPRVPRLYSTSTPSSKLLASPSKLLQKEAHTKIKMSNIHKLHLWHAIIQILKCHYMHGKFLFSTFWILNGIIILYLDSIITEDRLPHLHTTPVKKPINTAFAKYIINRT
jgi:hypothetical protein